MKLTTASLLQEEQLDWLWPGLIPLTQITILEGDPGTAKSTLTLQLCSHITTGTNWPDGMPCPTGDVIICNAEDPERSIILPRLIAAGADLTKCHILHPDKDNPNDQPFIVPNSVGALEKEILNHDWVVRLIVLDPIEAFLGLATDNYRNHHVRHALRSLELIAERLHCAVIFVRHLNKSTDKAAIYRGGGSIGMIGAARAALSVGRDPTNKDRCIVVPVKQNWTKMRGGIAYRPVESTHASKTTGEVIVTSKIIWDGEIDVTADDVISSEPDTQSVGKMDEAAVFLQEELGNGAKKSNEVFANASKAGISRKTLYGAAKFLGIRKYKEGFGTNGPWLWELRDSQDDDLLGSWAGEIKVEDVKASNDKLSEIDLAEI